MNQWKWVRATGAILVCAAVWAVASAQSSAPSGRRSMQRRCTREARLRAIAMATARGRIALRARGRMLPDAVWYCRRRRRRAGGCMRPLWPLPN